MKMFYNMHAEDRKALINAKDRGEVIQYFTHRDWHDARPTHGPVTPCFNDTWQLNPRVVYRVKPRMTDEERAALAKRRIAEATAKLAAAEESLKLANRRLFRELTPYIALAVVGFVLWLGILK